MISLDYQYIQSEAFASSPDVEQALVWNMVTSMERIRSLENSRTLAFHEAENRSSYISGLTLGVAITGMILLWVLLARTGSADE